jgi:hypothetical protein
MYSLKFVLIIIVFYVYSPQVAAKKRCKPLLDKLHNVQALQRSGHSSKRGLSLRGREDKARQHWWECENNKRKKKKKSKKKNKKVSYNRKKRPESQKITAGIPFETHNAIVFKSPYKGNKKQAWLKYYQQPEKCIQPKKLSIFAYCSENKLTQRESFNEQYSK